MHKINNLGQVFTPEHIVSKMVNLIQNGNSILEPSCGDGIFLKYLTKNTKLKGHCIFISNKKKIVQKFYQNLFSWLFKCENYFGLSNLKGYGQQRIYSFLTERYMPYWFEKNSKVLTWPWVYYDISKNN